MKQHNQEPCHKDPVCGMEVSHNTAADELEYQGKTCYFCARACREAFETDPMKYLRMHRQHGIIKGLIMPGHCQKGVAP
jgi:YHS domain-containing protein